MHTDLCNGCHSLPPSQEEKHLCSPSSDIPGTIQGDGGGSSLETQAVGTSGGADSQSQVFRCGQICCDRAASANTATGRGLPSSGGHTGSQKVQGSLVTEPGSHFPPQTSHCPCFPLGCVSRCIYLQSQQLSLQFCLGESKGHSLCMSSGSQAPRVSAGLLLSSP